MLCFVYALLFLVVSSELALMYIITLEKVARNWTLQVAASILQCFPEPSNGLLPVYFCTRLAWGKLHIESLELNGAILLNQELDKLVRLGGVGHLS